MELWIVQARLETEDFGKEWIYLVKADTNNEARDMVKLNLGFPDLEIKARKVWPFAISILIGYSSWGIREE